MRSTFASLGRPETKYAATPYGYIGYQVFGSGERDIIFITGAITNLDAIWFEPTAVRFLDRLADLGRVIQFDMLGSGVSDPVPNRSMWLPLEGNVDTVIGVLDAVGSEQAVIYGDTEGGFSAMMLAATAPDRDIPHAELRLVEGADTVPFHAGDFGPTLDAVEDFLTGRRDSAPTERVLATVLFTDIVDSTSRASELGDQRWLDLLGDHDRIVQAQVDRYRGRVIKMTGDGAVATFDGPARAISCAVAITEMVQRLGLPIRAGIHTGEVTMRDGDAHGLGMHIAARVMSHAETGGIVVSGTVKDLVVGSGIQFEPRGVVELRGVPGSWELFEVTSLQRTSEPAAPLPLYRT